MRVRRQVDACVSASESEPLEARRYMHTTYVYMAKNGLRAKERSCEFIARALLCPMRARERARVHVNLRPAFYLRPRPTHGGL